MVSEYRVQLDVFSGPLDLLLYLIRRDELDIQDIRIARLTEQYLEYLQVIEVLDPNAIAEFLVMASTLIEMKSRALLPTPPIEAAEDADDPRNVLVKQLLEYKRFKDAAARLGHAADERAKRFVRRPAALPPDLQGVELEEAQVWDLVAAFGRVMSSIGAGPKLHEVTLDEKPQEFYARRILDAINDDRPTTFGTLFTRENTRAEIIGMFLALLELIRKQLVRAEQDTSRSQIYLFMLEEVPDDSPPIIPFNNAAPTELPPATPPLYDHETSGPPRADERDETDTQAAAEAAQEEGDDEQAQ